MANVVPEINSNDKTAWGIRKNNTKDFMLSKKYGEENYNKITINTTTLNKTENYKTHVDVLLNSWGQTAKRPKIK